MAELVDVGNYHDAVPAELARARLTSNGIRAFVVDSAAFNPLLNDAVGGVRLRVYEEDEARARELLVETLEEQDDDEDVVRCPRCELQYCFYERPRVHSTSPAAAGNLLVVVASIFLRFSRKRWSCHKCGHVWDDAKEGPKRMTRLEPDDPRPVFLLRRTSAGMGLFLGVMVGLFGAVIAGGEAGIVVAVASPIIGWLLGRALVRHVCSEPTCRAPLHSDADACSRCKGSLAGSISSASEHFSAAADFRRELAAGRKSPPRKKRRRTAAAASPE